MNIILMKWFMQIQNFKQIKFCSYQFLLIYKASFKKKINFVTQLNYLISQLSSNIFKYFVGGEE